MISDRYFSDSQSRSARMKKNIVSSFAVKFVSVLINLALVPLIINYLSPTKYGVWLTISSMLGWISFFDIGLGHGLRNKLAEAMAKNEMTKAKAYVSSAYLSITVICCLLFTAFVFLNSHLDWNAILKLRDDGREDLRAVAFLLFSMFSVQFILQLINSVFLSHQQPALVSLYGMLSNLAVLLSIIVLIRYTHESLYLIALVFSIIPVIVLAGVNVFYFRNSFRNIAPSLKDIDLGLLREVLGLGIKFFVIQLTVLIFFQTSNLLICRFFSPELVTPYNIAFRYFGMITMVFSIITAPYWSAFTEAYVKLDFAWIRNSLKQLLAGWLILVVVAIIMLVFSNSAYRLWVGNKVVVDFRISLFMMLYTVIICFGNMYIMVLNGIGQIRLQILVNVAGMLLFVPLAYYLAVTLKMGIVGIILSTIICSIYGAAVAPFEVKRILNRQTTQSD